MSSRQDKVILSIVLQGRNDGYMENFEWRLSTSINKISQNIANLNYSGIVQIILVDWGSEKPLTDVLKLNNYAKDYLDVIYVEKQIADKYNRDSEYSMVHAINTGIRRASGKYTMFCDGDTYISLETMKNIVELIVGKSDISIPLDQSLLMASRNHIPKSFQFSNPSLTEIDNFIKEKQTELNHDKINLTDFVGMATAYLMSSEIWRDCTGFDESLIYWGWFDIDLFYRIKSTYQIYDFENLGMPFYHLEHYSNSQNRYMNAENSRKINLAVMPQTFAPNNSRWGLSDELLSLQKMEKTTAKEQIFNSQLNNIIAPEIRDNEFYFEIVKLAKRKEIKTILEIGSSAGDGSTEAFVKGLRQNPGKPAMFCMEVSKIRFAELKKRYCKDKFVKCYNVSSVAVEDFPSREKVKEFYNSNRTTLNQYPVEQIIGWLEQDIDYVKSTGVNDNGIHIIREDNNIQNFDLVLIDGSEFTGSVELNKVYGAKYILLDDINAYKNYESYQRLKKDKNYILIKENWNVRNGYAIFKFDDKDLPVHFFTIVLNGEPFIRYHIDLFKQLPFKWHWHIIEGVAELKNDTAWSVSLGGKVPENFHKNGLSTDGTTEYLNELREQFPHNVTIYRKRKGEFWNGKLEMVNAPLSRIKEESLLFEIDSDELWSFEQILNVRKIFKENPEKTAAFYWCHFYVGEKLVTTEENAYSKTPVYEWIRTWRFKPGYRWISHEPPALCMQNRQGEWVDLVKINPFLHDETEAKGLVFHHYAYVLEKQLKFKEIYYGYTDALLEWKKLQNANRYPVVLRNYFSWVNDLQKVDTIRSQNIVPIAQKDERGKFVFNYVTEDLNNKSTTVSNQSNFNEQSTIKSLRGKQGKIVIDGVIYYLQKNHPAGIIRVWTALLQELSKTDLAKQIVLLDRGGTAPDIPGIRKRLVHEYNYLLFEADSLYLEEICREEQADLFISTYYTYPENAHFAIMLHDMIPELCGMDLSLPQWRAKTIALEKAKAYFAVSESTRDDFRKFFPQFNDRQVYVVPNAVASTFTTHKDSDLKKFKKKYNLKKPYFILSGSRILYKNAIQFFKAFALLENKEQFEIFCTGGAANLENVFKPYVRGVTCHVRFLSDKELSIAYSGAVALVYPSLYEGFGLPILEAMQSGCPVITCKNSSIPEVAGEAAIYVKESDVADMLAALQFVQKSGNRKRFIEKGLANVARFSWRDSAQKFVTAIRDVVQTVAGMPFNEDDPIYTEKRLFYVLKKQQGNSPLVTAMANHLKVFTGSATYDHKAIEQDENIIARMDSSTFELMRKEFYGQMEVSAVFCYWFGLALHFRKQYNKALDAFIKAFDRGVGYRWRIAYLAAVSAYDDYNLVAAEILLKEIVLKVFPNYKPAHDKLKDVMREKTQVLRTSAKVKRKRIKTEVKMSDFHMEGPAEPLVSAIVSTYNSERFIRGCLEDLEAQSIAQHLEIIVVDSASEQNEKKIVRDFQKRYSNIKYIRSKKREGVYAAWNRGIKIARGKYITNANTDDRHKHDAFEKMVNVLEKNPELALVYANVHITKTENETFENHTRTGSFRWYDFDFIRLIDGCYMGPQPMWRRNLHEKYGYFDEHYRSAGDWEFWLRLGRTESFFHLDEYLGLYLQSPDSLEHCDPQLSIREARKIQKQYLPFKREFIKKQFELAEKHLKKDDLVEGLELLSGILDYEPNHFDTLCLIGDLYQRLGEESKAEQMWKLASKQEQRDADLLRRLSKPDGNNDGLEDLFEQGKVLIQKNDLAGGLKVLSELLDIDPTHKETLLLMSDVYEKIGKHEDAEGMRKLI